MFYSLKIPRCSPKKSKAHPKYPGSRAKVPV